MVEDRHVDSTQPVFSHSLLTRGTVLSLVLFVLRTWIGYLYMKTAAS